MVFMDDHSRWLCIIENFNGRIVICRCSSFLDFGIIKKKTKKMSRDVIPVEISLEKF